MQRTRGNIQSNDKHNSQVGVAEAPNNSMEEYLKLHFIPYLQSEKILVFEVSLCRSNVVVQMSQQLPHLIFPIGEGTKSSCMYGLADTGSRLNLGNIE